MNGNNTYQDFLKKFLSNIDDDIQNSKLAIFVGSGISACSGYPTWSSVIKKFAEPLGMSKDYELKERDYLEIPDKFFYKFKNFEYKKLLNNIFDIQHTNLNLQEKILQINPYHIITTNWDNLLEMAMLQTENRYYDIVHNDNDLSKANNTKLIIKMHGSLSKLYDNDNAIVMKESDYLSYSDNFPLIENFIKSIFSTKRVLFIGYSLSDRNVQQILHWVKNRTINHIFPYLILNGKYDEIEFSFYKEKGLFLIYLDEVLSFMNEKSESSYFEKYNKILDLIINRKQLIEKNKSIIEKVFNNLKTYEQFHFLSIDILIDILKNELKISSSYGVFGDRTLYLLSLSEYQKQEIEEILKKLSRLINVMKLRTHFKPKFNEKEIYILEKLYESNIESISLDLNKQLNMDLSILYGKIKRIETFNLFQTLINFDFDKALDYIHGEMTLNIKVSEQNKIKLFKAYILYKIEKYDEAIVILQEIQKNSYLNKDFYIYFIAKTDLKYICHIKKLNTINDFNSFCNKYSIDEKSLEEEIYNLPVKYDKKHILKITNFDYFYEKFFKIQKLYDDNLKTKQVFEQGGSSTNNKHSEIYNEIYNIFSMINFNFLTIDRYIYIQEIYSKSFQAIIFNYSVVDNFSVQKLSKRLSFPINQFQKLNQFIFYLGINGAMNFEQLSDFLNTTLIYKNIKTGKKEYKFLEFNDINNIIEIMLVNIRKYENKSKFNNLNLFNKSVIILSWAVLTSEHIKQILELFIEDLNLKMYLDDYKLIGIFLINQSNFIKSDNLKLLESILDKFILKFIIGSSSIDEHTIKRINFTDTIFHIFKENQFKLQISLDRILIFCSKLPIQEEPLFSLYLMSLIYSLNKEKYSDLKEKQIQMLLNDINKKSNSENTELMNEINELLDIE